MHRVAVINFTRLGDLIQSSPLLRAIKSDSEDAQITLVVFEKFREAAQRLPMVDSVIALDVDSWVPLLDERRGGVAAAYTYIHEWLSENQLRGFDQLYNLSHTRQSAMLCGMFDSRVAYGMIRRSNGRLMINGEWFNYLFSIMQGRTWNPFNLVEIYQRFHSAGKHSAKLEMDVYPSDRASALKLLSDHRLSSSKPYVVVQAGASTPSRQWPADSIAELIVGLTAMGRQVVLTGSAEESGLLEEIVAKSGDNAVSLAGQTPIGVLAAVLEGAEKLISNDTGTIHLAAAVGTPTIGIYIGPASAKETAPYGTGHIIVEADLPCAPCGYQDRCACPDCARQIKVEQICDLAVERQSEQGKKAKAMTGVRVYRTHVGADGTFELRNLNQAHNTMDRVHLDYFRAFWDRLLDDSNNNYSASDKMRNIRHDIQGIAELERLLRSAQRAFMHLEMQRHQRPRDNTKLSEALRMQTEWQDKLLHLISAFPMQSAFIRYLLVKLSMIDLDDLDAYIRDLQQVLNRFDKAVSLLACEGRTINQLIEPNACTV